MDKNITHITVRRLLPLVLILMLCIILVIGLNFRSLVLSSMQERAFSIAEIAKAGLTAHMKSGLMSKRAYFLHEIASAPHVKSLTIIRSDEVCEQFGECIVGEKMVDDSLRAIMNSKKPYVTMSDWDQKATIRAIVPYIATSKGSLNCLMCHHVAENTVLGAIDIELDVTEYRNKAWMYLLIVFGVIGFFSIMIALNMSHVIEQFVRKPLLTLIQLAKAVFFQTDIKDHDTFESKEFKEVAFQFVQLGKELKDRDLRIEQTTTKFHSLNSEIDTTLKETLFAMGEAEEARSKETRQHTLRVVEYSRLFATLCGIKEHDIDLLVTAAPLHDIGKIGIPDSILLKVGPLNDEERTIMKTHSQLGYDILKHSEREVLQAAATIALEHHERWDGFGYPKGLKGENIHIFGRIVSMVDVFDALSTKRVYKEAWPLEKVRAYFKEESGKSFDPHLCDLLNENFYRFEALYMQYYKNM